MAESTESTGSEFPIFKSEGGAFDRAKFQSAIMNNTVGTIPRETFEAMEAANSVSNAAKIFYDKSFDQNIKDLAPELDTKSVYYKESYSDSGSDKREISRRIDGGETIDGKEIFEMSKSSAVNKIANAEILKTGKPTEIIENLGYKDIKNFEAFEDVRNEFDDKVKDEKIKFDVLVSKFLDVLEYFNDERPIDDRASSMLYTPENVAIISALSKILEAEGFNNESVIDMSKKYEDNLNKLLEKKETEKIESVEQELLENRPTENNILNTAEQRREEDRLEEKREENIPPSPIEPVVPLIEQPTTNTETVTTATGTSGNETILEERSAIETPTQQNIIPPAPEIKSSETKITGSKPTTGAGNDRSAVERAQDEIFSMLGLKLPGTTKGSDIDIKSVATSVGNVSTIGSAQDKILESLGFTKSVPSINPTQTPMISLNNPVTKEINETKILEKKEILTNKGIQNETFSGNLPIKETNIQNLSTVSTPEPTTNTNTGVSNTQNINTPTNNPPVVNTENTENKVESTNNPAVNDVKPMDNNVNEETEKMNREMVNNMKMMVNLLGQLNNTLQSPLIVIPNDKKFG